MAIEWLGGAKSGLAGLGSGNTGAATFAKIGAAGTVVSSIFLGIVMLAVVIFIARQLMMYTMDVYVFKKYSTGMKLVKLRGRYYKDKKGHYKFTVIRGLLQWRAKSISLVEQEFFITKPGKGEAVFLLQVSPDDFKPIALAKAVRDQASCMELSVLDQNAANHSLQVQKEIVDKHRNVSKMLLYLPTIMMVGGMIFVVVLLWMTLGRIESMNASMLQGYELMANAIGDFGKQIIT